MGKRRSTDEAKRLLSAMERDVAKGLTVELACRKIGIGVNNYYRWKQRFNSELFVDAGRVRELESENRRLKNLVAELALEKQMLQEVAQKKW